MMNITNKQLKQLSIQFARELQHEDFDAIKYLIGELVDLIDLKNTDQTKLADLVEQLEDLFDESKITTEPRVVAQTTTVDDMINKLFGDR